MVADLQYQGRREGFRQASIVDRVKGREWLAVVAQVKSNTSEHIKKREEATARSSNVGENSYIAMYCTADHPSFL